MEKYVLPDLSADLKEDLNYVNNVSDNVPINRTQNKNIKYPYPYLNYFQN